jgi:hypothetical protein
VYDYGILHVYLPALVPLVDGYVYRYSFKMRGMAPIFKLVRHKLIDIAYLETYLPITTTTMGYKLLDSKIKLMGAASLYCG